MQYNEAKGKNSMTVRNSRRHAWKKIVFIMGCVVVFCTTYALILPAITMEVPTYCGFEEHIHTDECYRQITSENKITPIPVESNPNIHHHTSTCYDELGTLICGEADFVVHTHDENCYNTDGSLWCPLPEISLHIHDESCNIPQDDENQFHIHTDECYELRKKYICGFDAPETDIFGNEIIGGIETDFPISTDNGFFPAPPVDEFASGEVTMVSEDETAEPALPELSEPVTQPSTETIPETISEPAVTEPFSEDMQTSTTFSDILQSETTPLQSDNNSFDEVIPGFGSPAEDITTAPMVHVHTDDCYIYEKVLICEKAESTQAADLGEYPIDLMTIGMENYGLTDNQEEPTDTIELEEPVIPDKSEYTDLLETNEEPIVTDELGNADELSNPGENENVDELGNPGEVLNQDWLPELGDGSNTSICAIPEVILHEHDSNCFNEFGELVCGMLAVRIHQHTQECEGICYITEEIPIDETALTCEIPVGEGAHLHSFEYGCFDENMNIICPLDESLGHVHDIHCYGKWELICGMEEHEHTEECGIDPDADDIEIEDDGITMLAVSPDTWGYNYENGSVSGIYWNRTFELATVPLSEIKEGAPYIFCGQNNYTLMTNEDFIMTDSGFQNQSIQHTYRKAVTLASVSNYSAYQYWHFERAAGENQFYIYSKDVTGKMHYLTFSEPDYYTTWKEYTANIILTEDKNSSVPFTVTPVAENALNIYSLIEGHTIYINPYFGDSNKTTCWWGHQSPANIKVCTPAPTVNENTANRLPTVASSNTIINLFDYWTASDGEEKRFINDNINDYDNSNLGINNNHTLKFSRNGAKNTINGWTGSEKPYNNLVENVLDNDGYPFLSLETTGSSESLAYLFNPDISHPGKISYSNVGGLLRNNDEGYFYFDCKETMAEYNESDNSIHIYDRPGVLSHNKNATGGYDVGMFFPFNNAPQVMETKCDTYPISHYFGMTITTRFFQKNGGYTKESNGIPTSFHFSGDDDVWIFIDDVLIGDGGGIHDACSIDINFVTGEVFINKGKVNETKTTLYDAYNVAGRLDSTTWSNNTFADNTTHTLKFFYLERGNYSSNLELKYNLISIPKTAIYKVDQYGQVVPGAKFAVYAANAYYDEDDNIVYEMLDKKDGSPVTEPENPKYDEYGNLLDDSNHIIAQALYTGITNYQGEMIFEDTTNHVPFTLTELQDRFGDHFILREIKVPDGYRIVSKDVYLEIWKGANQTILRCQNTNESGSRAASTLQVTATDKIWLKDGNGAKQEKYYEIIRNEATNHVTTKTYGTLFAVIMKYTGPVDSNGDPILESLGSNDSWTPVYGNDKIGYTLVDVKDHKGDIVSAAIEAAQKSQAEGNEVVFKVSPSCEMQVTLENLPGHITTYYRMLGENDKNKTRYTVGFYWTAANNINDATPNNTHSVYSHEDELEEIRIPGAKGFERAFGANIKVPNLINKIFVQKIDENNNLINGATFAIYRVQQDEASNEIKYRDINGTLVGLSENAEINGTTGYITDGSIKIKPVNVTTTATLPDNIHVGTGEFTNLDDGQYIIKEINAPAGYKINTTDIMVLVTEDTIYANAGTEDDGVIVGRGPGYVVSTLDHFASHDKIDNTLTWIYAQMRISGPSTSFYDIGKEDKIKGYISVNESSETNGTPNNSDGAFKTYLKYKPDDAVEVGHVAFNYYPNADRHNKDDELAQYRRIFTTSGWPYYELWQDYEFGLEQVANTSINYEDWSQNEITHLFSRSTYIRVMDDQDSTLTVCKKNADGNMTLSGASFRLYRLNSEGINEYYSLNNETDTVEWTSEADKATLITTEENGKPVNGFIHLKDGTYYLEEVAAPSGYIPLSSVVTVTINLTEADDRKAVATVPNGENTSTKLLTVDTELIKNSYTFTVTVRNTIGHELPQTGGCGTEVYTAVGISIIVISIALAVIKKRKTA